MSEDKQPVEIPPDIQKALDNLALFKKAFEEVFGETAGDGTPRETD